MEEDEYTSMAEVKSILNNVLLALQLILGLWQTIKLTPVGAIVEGVVAFLLRPLGLFSDYARAQSLPGKLFKRDVYCAKSTENLPTWLRNADVNAISEGINEVNIFSLGHHYRLRVDRDWKLEVEFGNEKMCYYITPKIWLYILSMKDDLSLLRHNVKREVVCIKGHREIWEGVATGGVMTFSEALDSVILDDMCFSPSNSTLLLPVNLSVSEERLLKFLNLVGLFLQMKKLHWAIPLSFSLTSAVLEFFTPLRVWLYDKINVLFCSAVRLICANLSYPKRREVYSLGKWVDNLQPSNDLEFRVVRGDRCVPLAGGAKVKEEGATPLPHQYLFTGQESGPVTLTRPIVFDCGYFKIGCFYRPLDNPRDSGIAYIEDNPFHGGRHICLLQVECTWEEYKKICALLSCIGKSRSGSLKLYDHDNKVQVYGLKDSIIHYVKSGFPPVYEIHLKDVILT